MVNVQMFLDILYLLFITSLVYCLFVVCNVLIKTVSTKNRRRQWHPTSVLSPRKSQGWRSLVDCSPWGWTQLSNFTFTFHFHTLEKEMATHSSVLVWRIPGMGEPGWLLSMGLHRVGYDWSNLAVATKNKRNQWKR